MLNRTYNATLIAQFILRLAFNGLEIILNSLQIHQLPLYAFNFMSEHNVMENAVEYQQIFLK
jgi:hypothetical protein